MDELSNNYIVTKRESNYWNQINEIAKDTAMQNRDMTDNEYINGIGMAAMAKKSNIQFVRDYWIAYWNIKNKIYKV